MTPARRHQSPPRPIPRNDSAQKIPADPIGAHYDTRLPDLPWSRRIQIPFIAAAVYSVIRILGPTLRYEVLGWQNAERVYASGKRCIWAFWHRVIIPIVWWQRNHGVVVMNTTAFDGQWTRKVIEWLGFGTAQGSSSRGGLARTRGHGSTPRRRRRLRLHDRRPARPSLHRQARPSHARPKNRLPRDGLPHRRRSRQNLRENLGSFPAARSFARGRNPVRSADLRPARRQSGSPRSQARGNAARTRTRPRHRRILVFSERIRSSKASRRIFATSDWRPAPSCSCPT